MPDNKTPEKILVIEDDKDIAEVLSMNLQDLGFQLTLEYNGIDGLTRARKETFDLILLDLMLPGLDGLSLCKKLREEENFTPLLMLTARAEEVDRILGLELGADDYMTKPFSIRELEARVKALLRRSRQMHSYSKQEESLPQEQQILRIGQLETDLNLRKVCLAGETMELTVKEFDLLVLFMQNPGRAFSRSDLLKLIWGYQFQGYEHTVNTHINRLRNKIEKDASNPEYLKTVWGIGYRFSSEGEVSP